MFIPYHHHLVDTGYLYHTWHIMDVQPLSPSLGWYGISVSHMTYNGCSAPFSITWRINIHYKSCVTQISRINQVMVIGDQHPLYVMCDTDIPYQPSDGDRASTSIISHVWHRYPVSTKWYNGCWFLSSSLGWYGISVSHMTYNGCWSPIIITWLIREICVTHDL
jgi:hypothetical protein